MKKPAEPQGDVYCTRCGMPYPSFPLPEHGCPACGNPEFGLYPDVLTDGWRRDTAGTLYEHLK